MLGFNGLRNTILTLECRAQEIPLVFQAEEDYEGDLGKKKCSYFGGCRLCRDKSY